MCGETLKRIRQRTSTDSSSYTDDAEAYYFAQVYFYSFVGGDDVAYLYNSTKNHASGPDVTIFYINSQ